MSMSLPMGHYDLVCSTHHVRVGGCRCPSPSKVQDLVPCTDRCPGTRMVIPEVKPGPRELDVLRLIAEGLTTVEIGARLYLSINTVKTYTKKLYRNLDVRNAAQAVAVGYQRGLLGTASGEVR